MNNFTMYVKQKKDLPKQKKHNPISLSPYLQETARLYTARIWRNLQSSKSGQRGYKVWHPPLLDDWRISPAQDVFRGVNNNNLEHDDEKKLLTDVWAYVSRLMTLTYMRMCEYVFSDIYWTSRQKERYAYGIDQVTNSISERLPILPYCVIAGIRGHLAGKPRKTLGIFREHGGRPRLDIATRLVHGFHHAHRAFCFGPRGKKMVKLFSSFIFLLRSHLIWPLISFSKLLLHTVLEN